MFVCAKRASEIESTAASQRTARTTAAAVAAAVAFSE